jgi:hypothetical protein
MTFQIALGSMNGCETWSLLLRERRADNLAAIYEPNVLKCGGLNLPQPLGPPRPVRG